MWKRALPKVLGLHLLWFVMQQLTFAFSCRYVLRIAWTLSLQLLLRIEQDNLSRTVYILSQTYLQTYLPFITNGSTTHSEKFIGDYVGVHVRVWFAILGFDLPSVKSKRKRFIATQLIALLMQLSRSVSSVSVYTVPSAHSHFLFHSLISSPEWTLQVTLQTCSSHEFSVWYVFVYLYECVLLRYFSWLFRF